jgi:hypothetical protein
MAFLYRQVAARSRSSLDSRGSAAYMASQCREYQQAATLSEGLRSRQGVLLDDTGWMSSHRPDRRELRVGEQNL